MPKQVIQDRSKQKIYRVFLVVVSFGLALVAVITPSLSQTLSPSLQAGQVVLQDYRANSDTSFESVVLTNQRRDAAADSVQPIYTPADTSIARQEIENLRSALSFITSVRNDTIASTSQKVEDLAAIEDIKLSEATALSLIALTDTRWGIIQQEALALLERVMSTTIRVDQVEGIRKNLPNLVSLSLPEEQAILVTELVIPFVTVNSEFSQELTDAARQNARESITPINRSYRANEVVVRAGQVLTEADIEALQQIGVIETRILWKEWLSAGAIVLVMTALVVSYFARYRELGEDLRALTLVLTLFFIFLYGARFVIPSHTVIPYAFPLSAFGLTVAALFRSRVAIIFSLPLAILAAYGLPNSLDLTLFYLLGSLTGILILRKANRLANFFWAGAAFAVAGILTIIAYRLQLPSTDLVGMATLAGVSIFNGLVTASLGILLQFFLAQIMGMTTPMQLMDLTRPDQPLLQYILREAPGSYQHSLQVANLAEQAAERIGANPLLTRVGALYHDAGKARFPIFFIENQAPGYPNPHENLDPESSSQIIIRHVSDGLKLAQKYRLPRRIQDFIAEHHGTTITRYQYVRAVQEAGGDETKVDKTRFQYPGPKPQSRETAILMLADGCEARVRAERPTDEDVIQSLVKSVINERIASGQLDDTDLTLNDLDVLQEIFTTTLKGIYHPRVKYPELEDSVLPRQELPEPEPETKSLPSPSITEAVPNPRNKAQVDTPTSQIP